MAVVQLTPRVWQLKLNLVNCYLLETEDGLLLIDTGYPNSTDKLFAAVRESGHDSARATPPWCKPSCTACWRWGS